MTHYDSRRTDSTSKRWSRRTALGLLVLTILAAVGIRIAADMFSRWTEVGTVTPAAAGREFAIALRQAGGGIPYVEIAPDGEVIVHRDQESIEPTPLDTLHLVAWDSSTGGLVRIDFPFWFVRLKMTDTINLGTITTVLAEDWDNLDLKVSVEDLERRGPAVVMDHTLVDGSRILLWTEKAGETP